MTKVLVTGANGYIGHHVVDDLIAKGCEVIAVSRNNSGINPKAKFCNESIFSGNPELYRYFGYPDACIHLAWRDGFEHNSNAHMRDLSKHYEFLTNMIDAGLPRLSVMGTMHEIGYWEGAIDENTPCNPRSQYGIAKNALRQSMLLYASKRKTKLNWLRAYYITGDDARSHSIFSKLLKASQEGKNEFPFTTGKNKYDFIDVEDLSEMIIAATLQTKINGIINCCSGEPVTLAERVEKFIKENNLCIKLDYGAFPDRDYDSPGVWGCTSKIEAIMKNVAEI